MNLQFTALAVATAIACGGLTACGGGGGGGSSATIPVRPDTTTTGIPPVTTKSTPVVTSTPTVTPTVTTTIVNTVPYHTPVRVGSVEPLTGTGTNGLNTSSAIFAHSLSGGTGQEIIMAGRMDPGYNNSNYRNSQLSIWGWQNGTLVNQTSRWFSGTDNVIVGSEPSVKFADFNGDGRTDMYVSPNTDTDIYGPGAAFINTGSSFTRVNIDVGNLNGHDSAVHDMDGDGRADIVTVGYGRNMIMSFGNANGTFSNYRTPDWQGGASGIAVADFMGNKTSSMILLQVDVNRLFSWNLVDGQIQLTQQSVLPTPRFLLPKWSSYNFSGAHDVRALAFDFDNSGLTSAVIFSRPWITNNAWPNYSEVQFLKNQGAGTFVDVTDTTLIGYNTASPVSYNPTLMDINGDGLTDIVLSSPNWESNAGSQVLIHTKEHKYVASYATVLEAFQNQALNLEKAINASAKHGANGIVFVKGPDGAVYLATAVTYDTANTTNKAIYLSRLGNGAASVPATVTAIRQNWPWMSDAQVNSVLAASSTQWLGFNLIDPARVMQPIGELKIPGANQLMSLNGGAIGLNLNGAANSIKVLDSVGRDFSINYSSTAMPGFNAWSRFSDNIRDDTRGAQTAPMPTFSFNGIKAAASEDGRQMAFGLTGYSLGRNTQLSMQYTQLPFSPFVQLSGSWGLVRSSGTLESTITARQGSAVAKFGTMYTLTEIDPGLVTRVNPITSVWAEVGYEQERFRMYGGVLPQVIAGSADLTMPTGVDNTGKITYTRTQADIVSNSVAYSRFTFGDRLTRNVSYRLQGMFTTQQQHNVSAELRLTF